MKTPAKILTGLLLGATVLAAVPVVAQNVAPPAPPPAVQQGTPGPAPAPMPGPDSMGGPDDMNGQMGQGDDSSGWWGHRMGRHGKGGCGGNDGDQAGWWGHRRGHGGGWWGNTQDDGPRGRWGDGNDDGPRGRWAQGPGGDNERGPMRMLRIIDTNGDGVIGDDEAASRVEGVFMAMDADSSGDITQEEFMAVRMGPGDGRNPDRMAQMQERKKARFAEMDADKDGKVTKEQFLAAGKARFLAADADKDGKVTPWEFRGQHMN